MEDTQTLNIDINASDETHGSCSGTNVTAYLVPAEESANGQPKIYLFPNVGSGWPMMAHNSRHLCLGSVNVDFVAESLVEKLESQKEKLLKIAGCYEGSEWDGSNHIGHWADAEWIDETIHYLDLECEYYCDAGDWMGNESSASICDQLDDHNFDIQSMSESIVDEAEGEARLDVDDVAEVIRSRMGDHLNELRDTLQNEHLDEPFTYRTTGYTHDVANDQSSAGGVHLHCVQHTADGYEYVICQSNGNRQAYGEYEPVTEEDALDRMSRIDTDNPDFVDDAEVKELARLMIALKKCLGC